MFSSMSGAEFPIWARPASSSMIRKRHVVVPVTSPADDRELD
jgi:hypothetical protein